MLDHSLYPSRPRNLSAGVRHHYVLFFFPELGVSDLPWKEAAKLFFPRHLRQLCIIDRYTVGYSWCSLTAIFYEHDMQSHVLKTVYYGSDQSMCNSVDSRFQEGMLLKPGSIATLEQQSLGTRLQTAMNML